MTSSKTALIATISLGLVTLAGVGIALAQDRGMRGDANEDGQITRQEMVDGAEERFNKLDSNGDGVVTDAEMKAHRDEMREKYKERRGDRMDRRGKQGAKRFSQLDANGDGRVSRAEMMDTTSGKFSELDENNDGYLTEEEMKAAHDKRKAAWKEKRSKAE